MSQEPDFMKLYDIPDRIVTDPQREQINYNIVRSDHPVIPQYNWRSEMKYITSTPTIPTTTTTTTEIINTPSDPPFIKTNPQTTFLHIQSSQRISDYTVSRYKYQLPRQFNNVKAINIKSIKIQNNTSIIDETNDNLLFILENYPGVISIYIPHGDYSLSTLVDEINRQFLTSVPFPFQIIANVVGATGLITFRAYITQQLPTNPFEEYVYHPAATISQVNTLNYQVGSIINVYIPNHKLSRGDYIEFINTGKNILNTIHVVEKVIDSSHIQIHVNNVQAESSRDYLSVKQILSLGDKSATTPVISPSNGAMVGTWSGVSHVFYSWRSGVSSVYIQNQNLLLSTTIFKIQFSPSGEHLLSSEISGWNAYQFNSAQWIPVNNALINYPETGPTANWSLSNNLDYVSYQSGATFGIYVRNGVSWIYREGIYPTPSAAYITYDRLDPTFTMDIHINDDASKMSLMAYPVVFDNINVLAASLCRASWFYNLDFTYGSTQYSEYLHPVAAGITWSSELGSVRTINGSHLYKHTYVVSDSLKHHMEDSSRKGTILYHHIGATTTIITPYPNSYMSSFDTDNVPCFNKIAVHTTSMIVAQVSDTGFNEGYLVIINNRPAYFFDRFIIQDKSYRLMNFNSAQFSQNGYMMIHDGLNFQIIDMNIDNTLRTYGGSNATLRIPQYLSIITSTSLSTQLNFTAGISNHVISNSNISHVDITFIRGMNINGDIFMSLLPDDNAASYITTGSEIYFPTGITIIGRETFNDRVGSYILSKPLDSGSISSAQIHSMFWVYRPELSISGNVGLFIPTDSVIAGDTVQVDNASYTISEVGTTFGHYLTTTPSVTSIPTSYTWTNVSIQNMYYDSANFDAHKVVKTYFKRTQGTTQMWQIKMPFFNNAYNELDSYNTLLVETATTRRLGITSIVYQPTDQLGLIVSNSQLHAKCINIQSPASIPLLERDNYIFLSFDNINLSSDNGGIRNDERENYIARVQLSSAYREQSLNTFLSNGVEFNVPLRSLDYLMISWFDKNNQTFTPSEHTMVLEIIEYIDTISENNISSRIGIHDRRSNTDVFDITR